MRIAALPFDLLLILTLLAVVVPWRGVTRMRSLSARQNLTSADRVALYGSTIALQWLVTGVTAWRCAAHGLLWADLGVGLPNPRSALAVGLAIAGVFAVIQLAGIRALSRIPAEQRGRVYELASKIMPRNAIDAVGFVALVCTVSVCEEFLYRGFAFAIALELFHRSMTLAIIASSALFAIGHLYQGRRGILNTFALGVIFSGARVFTGSLAPGMMAHFVVDSMAGFAAVGSSGEAEQRTPGGAERPENDGGAV